MKKSIQLLADSSLLEIAGGRTSDPVGYVLPTSFSQFTTTLLSSYKTGGSTGALSYLKFVVSGYFGDGGGDDGPILG
ncbi:MAG: hypothetical protein K0Q74_1639 [Gammaproteobacteria bacterium]|nr:hypothetical protein [Gammaproteobacteria bacterium]